MQKKWNILCGGISYEVSKLPSSVIHSLYVSEDLNASSVNFRLRLNLKELGRAIPEIKIFDLKLGNLTD